MQFEWRNNLFLFKTANKMGFFEFWIKVIRISEGPPYCVMCYICVTNLYDMCVYVCGPGRYYCL